MPDKEIVQYITKHVTCTHMQTILVPNGEDGEDFFVVN